LILRSRGRAHRVRTGIDTVVPMGVPDKRTSGLPQGNAGHPGEHRWC
jgi:hypothetical protein